MNFKKNNKVNPIDRNNIFELIDNTYQLFELIKNQNFNFEAFIF